MLEENLNHRFVPLLALKFLYISTRRSSVDTAAITVEFLASTQRALIASTTSLKLID